MPEYTDGDVQTPEAAPSEQLKSISTSVFQKEEAPKPEPVEAQAEQVADTEEGEEPSGEGDAKPADSQKKRSDRLPRWVKERLARERETTARQTEDRIRKEYEARQPQATESRATESGPAKKTIADFDFDTEAYTAYLVDERLKAAEQRREAETLERSQREASEKFKQRIDAFEEEAGAGAWEDIESSALNQDGRFAQLAGMIMQEENGLRLAHHLAMNPDEAERIVRLSTLGQARELAAISDRLTPSKPPIRTTKAPPPPRTVTGAGKPTLNVDDPNISPEDRIKAWREQGILKSRR